MVQVYEANPSFGSQIGRSLGEGLGSALGGAVQGHMQRKKSEQFAKAFKERTGMDISDYPPEFQQQFALEMAKEQQKQKGKSGLYESLFGNKGAQNQNQDPGAAGKMGFQPLPIEQETMLALEDPTAFHAYTNLKEHHQKEQQKVETKENLQSTLEEMVNTLVEGNLGITPSRYTSKGRRDVQYFDTLGTQLESIGKDMVSKGVLSAPRFAYLIGNLPSSGKTDASNAGALEAWAKELNLDIHNIEELKSLYGKKSSKGSKSKKVKFDVANPEHKAKRDQAMKKAGGDREKVKEILNREFEE